MNQHEELNGEFFKHFYKDDLYLIKSETPKEPSPVSNSTAKPETPVPDVFAEAKPTPVPVQPPKELPFVATGGNKKGVAIVLSLFTADFATVRQNQMLTRLLAAIGLGPDDVLYVNLTGQVDNLELLYNELTFDQSILFLAPKHPLVLKEKLKQFQPMSVKGKYVIAAAELSALETYVEQKKQLWTGLQAMFL